MPDNRSLWSDGPSEDEHHGWLDPEPETPAAAGPEQRPAAADEPTKQHRTGRMTPREPREGPSAWEQVRGRLVTPLAILCAVTLLVSGVAIGMQVVGERTVERTVVSGSGTGASSAQIKAAYEATHEGVVRVTTGSGNGTGWVFDDRGTIVTNNHVVSGGGDTVQVQFKDDGDQVDARVLGTDVSSDLAVLRVDPDDVDKLVPLKVAESDDVETGDSVIAIGYPLGLDQTTTAGIISGVGRSIPAENRFSIDEVLQTDAPINPGNSGGPLVNMKGEVVGVNAQIRTTNGGSIGIGYAIPSDTVRDVVPKLENGQKIPRAWLGVQMGELARGSGAAVVVATPGGPAERANLEPSSAATRTTPAGALVDPDGDVITKLGDDEIRTPEDVTRLVNGRKPGDRITMEVERGGTRRDVQVTLGDRPSTSASSGSPTLTLPTTPTTPSNPSNPGSPSSPGFPSIP